MDPNQAGLSALKTAEEIRDFSRPTWVRYQVLAAACSVAVVTYIHRVGFAHAGPELQKALDLSHLHLAILTAAFLLAYAGFEIPGGLLGDRFGVRHLLTILVLGWSLMTGGIALVVLLPGLWLLRFSFVLLLRFLFGMFQAGAFPSLSRMMADWMPMQERASAQGIIWMSSRFGALVVPFILLWLFNLYGSWESPLWILAGLGFVWCAAFWPWFRNKPEEMKQVNIGERQLIAAGRGQAPPGHGQVPWSKMLRSPSIWGLCLMYGFGGFAANFYVTLLPTYLRTYRGLTPEQSTWLASAPFACGMVGCVGGGIFSDWLIRRTGNRKWARRVNGLVGLGLGGLGWLSMNWVQETWALAFVVCAIFFFNDINMGPAWASCADIGRRYAGTIGGAMNMVGNLLGVGGNLIAGFLFDRQQSGLVFIIYACSFGLASLCWFLVDVTKPLIENEADLTAVPT